ncbi:hypothetical protein GCM10011506_24240 [Marivirga lumbricoides]|uniref:Uncharacterized protein n=1 Tax=Marivirga lumbricoides TaxID=1046115 RepID=A0ABQ1MBL9_9BACT|nr:hypothetical protein GCM10011506_24240 [Marivirga lumbricoides]
MTRGEQLEFCKRCTNRKMDMQQGLLCSLTGQKADFTDRCENFNEDTTVKVDTSHYNDEPLIAQDFASTLSSQVLEKLRLEQNLPLAILAGVVAGLVGSVLWAMLTVATGYQIGYVAIAIGAGVGFSMRFAGKGIDQIFGITGAVIAVLSCVTGNFLSSIGFIADYESLGYFETLTMFDYNYLIPLMKETFSVMDVIFYGIAGYEGYKFAFRSFTQDDIRVLKG